MKKLIFIYLLLTIAGIYQLNSNPPDSSDGGGLGKKGAFEEFEELMNSYEEEELFVKLEQNSPNPFRDYTEIKYFLSQGSHVKLTLYETTGKEVKVLVNKYLNGGWYNEIINSHELNSGVYIFRLEADNKVLIKQMHVVK